MNSERNDKVREDTKALRLEEFRIFCDENPLEFDTHQFERVKDDIQNPRDGIVSDEYVDFILWSKGIKSRQECFAEFVERKFPLAKYPEMLEVGAGRNARLSSLLSQKGYRMTAMDPQIRLFHKVNESVKYIRESFTYGKTDIAEYDAVIAQEPCEAAEHIIRECVKMRKDFVVGLCGTPHKLINGEMPADVYEWYRYLEAIDKENCMLTTPNLIPGYVSCVIIGKFGED